AKISIRDVDTPTLQVTVQNILALMIECESNETLKDVRDTVSTVSDYFQELAENTLRADSAKMLIMALYSVWRDASEINDMVRKAIDELYRIGIWSLEYDKRRDAETVCRGLIDVTSQTLTKDLDLALKSASFCNTIGVSALRPDEPELVYEGFHPSVGRISQRTILEVVADELYFIEYRALDEGNIRIAREAIDELKRMGADGVHNKKPKIAINTMDKLVKFINFSPSVYSKVSEDDLADIYKHIVNAISWILLQKGAEEIEVREKAAEVYFKIALEEIKRNKTEIMEETGVKIGRIGITASLNNESEFAEKIVDYLTPICMNCLKMKEAPEIVSKLLCMGAIAKEKDERSLEHKVKNSVSELLELSKDNELEDFFDRTIELAKKENNEYKLQIEKLLEEIDY
ncbi:MAG: hypothetical protein ACXQTL_08570, partial [Methanosarcinales archaeon]